MKTQLKKDEKIVLVTRPHIITLFYPFIILIIGIISGVVIGGYGYLIPSVLLIYFIYKFIERNNNLWAVTNLRVIDEYGVFSINSKESPLDKINNVSYKQPFWGRILGYGNVQIQTAAEIGSTTYFKVENPEKLKDSITNMQEEYKRYQMRMQAAELASAIAGGQQYSKFDISSELEKLYELKEKGILTEDEYIQRKRKILNS